MRTVKLAIYQTISFIYMKNIAWILRLNQMYYSPKSNSYLYNNKNVKLLKQGVILCHWLWKLEISPCLPAVCHLVTQWSLGMVRSPGRYVCQWYICQAHLCFLSCLTSNVCLMPHLLEMPLILKTNKPACKTTCSINSRSYRFIQISSAAQPIQTYSFVLWGLYF